MTEHFFFYLGLSFLIIHELDAVRCHEWRILPIFSWMNDRNGYIAFLFAHVPLLLWIFWALTQEPINEWFVEGFDLFMIIHIGLHLLLLKHKNNEFKDWVSWIFIVGAGGFGLLDLCL
ncbi:MAG: DUF6713 family protein [Bacteroidota bacterium]